MDLPCGYPEWSLEFSAALEYFKKGMSVDQIRRILDDVLKKSTNRIWYPGSSYAPQDWIDYLTNEINGNWTFTDQTETGWDWTLNSYRKK